MKKLALLLAASCLFAASAHANTYRYTERNTSNMNIFHDLSIPAFDALLVLDATNSFTHVALGTGLSYDSVGATLGVNNLPMANVTGLTTAISGKQAHSAVLDALALLPTDPDKIVHMDGTGAPVESDIHAPGLAMLATNTYGDMRTLLNVANGATANQTDAYLLSRANHTGTQAISTVTGLQTALDGKEGSITAGTTAQYWRGDKGWQALNKAAVGLPNVDNTADSAKPVSTAQQTALDLKLNIPAGTTSQVVLGNGALGARAAIKCVVGTSELADCFAVAKSATVASGSAVFHLTADGTSSGAALYPNGVQADSIQLRCDNEANAPCSFGAPALSNSNKTVTVAVNKSTGINVALVGLTLLGAPAAANGSVVKMTVLGN